VLGLSFQIWVYIKQSRILNIEVSINMGRVPLQSIGGELVLALPYLQKYFIIKGLPTKYNISTKPLLIVGGGGLLDIIFLLIPIRFVINKLA
jgi:hypothetical protein